MKVLLDLVGLSLRAIRPFTTPSQATSFKRPSRLKKVTLGAALCLFGHLAEAKPADSDTSWLVALTIKLSADPSGIEPFIAQAAANELKKATTDSQSKVILSDFSNIIEQARNIKTDNDFLAWTRSKEVSKYSDLRNVSRSVTDRTLSVRQGKIANSLNFSPGDKIGEAVLALADPGIRENVSALIGVPTVVSPDFLSKQLEKIDPAFANEIKAVIENSTSAEVTLKKLAGQLTEQVRSKTLDSINKVGQGAYPDNLAASISQYRGILAQSANAPRSFQELRTQASLVGLLGRLTDNPELSNAANQAMRFSEAAMEIQDACIIIASAATGWGVAFAIVSIAVSIGKLNDANNAPPDPSVQILQALNKMFEFLQKQFLIVNTKLDLIIDQVLEIQHDIATLKTKVDEIRERLDIVEHKVDSLFSKLDDVEYSVITELNEKEGYTCRRLAISGNPLSQTAFETCLSQFSRWADKSETRPLQRLPQDNDSSEVILRNLFNFDDGANRERAGRSLAALRDVLRSVADISDVANEPVPPNPYVLWTAAEGYLLMTERYPQQYALVAQSIRTADQTKLNRLFGDYRRYVNQLLTTKDSKPLFGKIVTAYKNANELMQRWMEAALSESVAEAFEETSSREANRKIPAGFGECNGRVLSEWNIFDEKDYRDPNPRLPKFVSTVIWSEETNEPVIKPFEICIKSYNKSLGQGGYKSAIMGSPDIVISVKLNGVEIAEVKWSQQVSWFDTTSSNTLAKALSDPLFALSQMTLDGKFDPPHDYLKRPLSNEIIKKLLEKPIQQKIVEMQLAAVAKNKLSMLKRVATKIAARKSVGQADSRVSFQTMTDLIELRTALVRATSLILFTNALNESEILRAQIFGRPSARLVDTWIIDQWSQCAKLGIDDPDDQRKKPVRWDLEKCSPEGKMIVKSGSAILGNQIVETASCGNQSTQPQPDVISTETEWACFLSRKIESADPPGDIKNILRESETFISILAKDKYWQSVEPPVNVGLELVADRIRVLQ